LRHFISVISIAGTLIGAIEGMTIISIFKKAKTLGDRKPEYSLNVHPFVVYVLTTIFVLGAFFLLI